MRVTQREFVKIFILIVKGSKPPLLWVTDATLGPWDTAQSLRDSMRVRLLKQTWRRNQGTGEGYAWLRVERPGQDPGWFWTGNAMAKALESHWA